MRVEDKVEELRKALETILPWASKAVADHPYNHTLGKRALDRAHEALAKIDGKE